MLRAKLSGSTDAAWLSAFRFLFGAALSFSMYRFIANGWIDRLFVEPRLFFKYWGFAWVEPLSGPAMHSLFWVLTGLAFSVAVGFCYRLSATLFALGLVYIQLLDVSTYLNHYYLAALLALLLAASPAHRFASVDAWLAQRGRGAASANASVSIVWLYLFRFQVGIVYVFAGLAKAESDWLVHAQPLRIWLGASTGLPIIGPLLLLPWVPLAMSWGGFLFDTTIVAFLASARTRPYAYAVVVVFHALTRLLFPIGMFPVIMTIGALVFFSPSWPRTLLGRLREACPSARIPTMPAALALTARRKVGVLLALAYAGIQLALPLRYLAYGGNVLWHEQGMRFSWRVMLRAKGGGTNFVLTDPQTGKVWYVSPRAYVTSMQESEMSSQPDLIVQLAHHIRDDFAARGYGAVEVRVESRAALNGRRSSPFIDPQLDLARVDDGWSLHSVVLPAPREAPAHTRPVL